LTAESAREWTPHARYGESKSDETGASRKSPVPLHSRARYLEEHLTPPQLALNRPRRRLPDPCALIPRRRRPGCYPHHLPPIPGRRPPACHPRRGPHESRPPTGQAGGTPSDASTHSGEWCGAMSSRRIRQPRWPEMRRGLGRWKGTAPDPPHTPSTGSGEIVAAWWRRGVKPDSPGSPTRRKHQRSWDGQWSPESPGGPWYPTFRRACT